MKYLLISVGTRGDMEPFIALGHLLKSKGHDVYCLFPQQFSHLAIESGLKVHALSKSFIELVESKEGKIAMGGKGTIFQKMRALLVLYKKSLLVNAEMVDQQHDFILKEEPDKVVYNGKSTYPMVWGIKNPGKTVLLSPVPCLIQPVKEYPHIGVHRNLGTFFNLLTYDLANTGLLANVKSTTKKYRKMWGIKGSEIKRHLMKTRTLYTVSPHLFAEPEYWPWNARVVGYHEKQANVDWTPHSDLLDFLAKHEKVLLITFGSMENPEPEKKSSIIFELLRELAIPAIINTSSGGLIKPREYDKELLFFVNRIPYHWIFPKVYALIHHGGSGTTHMALKYGCPSLIIPHIIDQFFWNKGLGPKGKAISKITEKNLKPLIHALWTKVEYKQRAREVAELIQKEGLTEIYYQELTKD